MTQIIYAHKELRRILKELEDLVARENKLHHMDMTIDLSDLEKLEFEIIPMIEEIVYYDPTP